MADLDLVSQLAPEERAIGRFRQRCFCPLDGKYAEKVEPLRDYLTAEAEWRACAHVQRTLLETRVEFGQAEQGNLDELDKALPNISPLNMALLEERVTKHDQLAVIEEIGRFVSQETKALLHPGTTSYDILDTVRSYLYKRAWHEQIRPVVAKPIAELCRLSVISSNTMQVGRTHLQNTSPVLFGGMLAGYAARLAERVEKCDAAFDDLRGKVSGIVGTGASIDMVVGEGKSIEFEEIVLEKLGLKPDYTATQIVQKERLADVGHGIITLMSVLGDFSEDIRQMYSSAIGEVTSRDNAERLGGSSASPGKNNPIEYENVSGSVSVAQAAISVFYSLIQSDFQRDLKGSVVARYQPGMVMAQCYESFGRLGKALGQLSINEDKMAANLEPVRQSPDEAMTAILRGEGWMHSKYGVGHEFVKKMVQTAKKSGAGLLDVCLEDGEFREVYDGLSEVKQKILNGEMEHYLGSAAERARINRDYALKVCTSGK